MDYTPLLWIALLIPLAMAVLTVAAAKWERRPIQPYYIPEPGAAFTPSPKHQKANEQAHELDFQHSTVCHDAKGKIYRIRYDFWISADNKTLALIGSGTIARLKVFGVTFYSRAADGRTLSTTNERGEQDISGVEEQHTWHAMPLPKLYEKHCQRLLQTAVDPFTNDSPLADYFDIRRRKAAALVERGYADYIDDRHLAWRYSFNGAVMFYLIAVIVRPIRRLLRAIGLVGE
jgi:hypothetical protein